MLNLENHEYFVKYVDPKSGVTSYILRKKIAPIQQHLYFSQPSVTSDGKHLFIRCSFPHPNEDRSFYHYDPHPQFVLDDKYIVSTTTVINGEIDVAITPVEPLIEKCRESGKIPE